MRVRTPLAEWKPWEPSLFPAHLSAAISNLRDRVLERIGPDGALRDPCHGRVLESALLLRLMERTGNTSPEKAGVTRFLEAHRGTRDVLDRILVEGALGRSEGFDSGLVTHYLEQVPAFAVSRKRLMLDVLLSLFGRPLPEYGNLRPGDFNTASLHSWAAVQVTAVKLILAFATGKLSLVRQGDIELLLSTQRAPWVWEGHVLVHLSVLHALSAVPGMAGTVQDGIGKALALQRADGGIPFISDTDTWCTATAGLALSAAEAHDSRLAGVARHLVNQQRPNGGWSFTGRAQQTDVDDTSVALEFLHSVDPEKYADDIAHGAASLLGVRHASGGFPTYLSSEPPEACMTAAAVNALSTAPRRYRQTLESGLTFLAEQQLADGCFAPDWSASRHHTLFRAVLAADSLGAKSPEHIRRMKVRALEAVRNTQNTDGGWGQQPGRPSDAMSTSYALIALCRQPDPAPAVRGALFLLGQQRPDGGITSVSDSIGPRPFIFAIPALADNFALLALGHLQHRLGGFRASTLADGARMASQNR